MLKRLFACILIVLALLTVVAPPIARADTCIGYIWHPIWCDWFICGWYPEYYEYECW